MRFVNLLSANYEEELVGDLVKAFLDIIVLAMLNGRPVHGYGIIADIHITFGVLLSPGSLYPLLYRLEAEKLVEVIEVKRRKLYQLTPRGRRKASKVIGLYMKYSDTVFRFIDTNLAEPLHAPIVS